MGVDLEQSAKTSGVNTSLTVNFTPTTNPSVIVVSVNIPDNPASVSISDSINGAYTNIGASGAAFSKTFAHYVKNTTTSALVITITPPGSAFMAISVMEFSGADPTTPLGDKGIGTNSSSGSSQDIDTSSAVDGSAGDAIVAVSGNYYAPTWSVGATNPGGMAIISGATESAGTAAGNVTAAYVILSGSYSAAVGNNPGTTTYGNTVGFQLVAAATGGTIASRGKIVLQAVKRAAYH